MISFSAKAKSMSQNTFFPEALHPRLSSSSFGPHLNPWTMNRQKVLKFVRKTFYDFLCTWSSWFKRFQRDILTSPCSTPSTILSVRPPDLHRRWIDHRTWRHTPDTPVGGILHPPNLPNQWMKSCSILQEFNDSIRFLRL